MGYVPDLTERYPDAGEPEEEREYIVAGWVPVLIELRVYGTDEDDAINEAKRKLKTAIIRDIIVNCDKSDFELSDIEEL